MKPSLPTSLLLLGTFFWGLTFVFIKEAVAEMDPFCFIAWRFALAVLALGLLFPRRVRAIRGRAVAVGCALGFVLAGSYITQTIGISQTLASKAGFITGLSVVLVPLLLPVLRRVRPGGRNLAAAALATAGLGLLTLSGPLALNPGDVWVLLCAVLFAVYIILVGKYSGSFDAVALTVVQLATVGVLAAAGASLTGGWSIPAGSAAWRAVLFCSLFATAFMYVVQNHYQRYVSEVKTAIIFSFEPLFAALAAFIYLHEPLSVNLVTGGALILAGMLLADARAANS